VFSSQASKKINAKNDQNGLKDINSAMKSVGKPLKIRPEIKELEKIVQEGLV